MVAVISMIIFAGALGTAIAVIAAAVGPQWSRIVRIAAGHGDRAFAPLETLVRAERRIAIRRRVSMPAPARHRLREVA